MNFLNILTLIIGYFVYLTYKPYLLDIAIAALMAIAFGKIDYFLTTKLKNRYLVSSISTTILAILILGPILYFAITAGKYISHLDVEFIKSIIEKAKHLLSYLPDLVANKIQNYLTQENIQKIYQNVIPIMATLTKKSASFIKDSFLIIIFFFFFSLYGKEILLFLKRILPLPNSQLREIFFSTSEVMSVVFYSTILTAILEGMLFGIIVSLYGLNPLFFTIMYAFASLIPVVGGILMWGPVSLYLYSVGNIQGAIIVVIYSVVVISIVADTFIKPMIIQYVKNIFEADTELNSLLIFFSIVAGLSSFGLWGIIIGPAVTSMFLSVISFYKKI